MHRSTGSLEANHGGTPMDERYSMIGFVVIVMLYAVIGVMAAAGAISITRKIGPKAEQVLYGLFLVIIAAFYLAFVAYFGNALAWRGGKGGVAFFSPLRPLWVA